MKRLIPLFAFVVAFALSTVPALAATYIVGAPVGAGQCTHASVQAAVDAAAASPGLDTIRITRSVAWTAQQVSVNSPQDLDLIGGYAACTSASADTTRTVLDGSGGQARPVLTVRGDGIVRLRNLTLTGGDQAGNDNGGGLFYQGGGILDIADTLISGNSAYNGGGIYAVGTSLLAEVILGANVSVSDNTARNSGGGMASVSLETTIRGPATTLWFNKALGQGGGGLGGGLLVISDDFKSIAYVTSDGVGEAGVVYANEAVRGGGIAVIGGVESGQFAQARLWSTDADVPVRVKGNVASSVGGGFYAKSDTDETAGEAVAAVLLFNAAVDDNRAPDGAALFIDYDEATIFSATWGADFHFNRNYIDVGAGPGYSGCPIGKPCGSISGNSTSNSTGAVVRVLSGFGDLNLRRVAIQGNTAGRLFYLTQDGSYGARLEIDNSLISGNTLAGELVRNTSTDFGGVTLSHVTIADNAIGSAHVLHSENFLRLDRSLVAQPGKITRSSAGSVEVIHVVTNSTTNLQVGPAVVAAPRFIDPAVGDYRLRAGSHAVDFGEIDTPQFPSDDVTPVDLFGTPHTFNMPVGGVQDRTADAGALERQALQPLVLNQNFDANLNLWTGLSDSFWDGSQNAIGMVGSGSVRVPFVVDPERPEAVLLAGRSQCIHLPGPGTYRVNGYGRLSSAPMFGGNSARLRWELRYNGGALGCEDGAYDVLGFQTVSTGTAWQHPSSPGPIVVPAALWTRNTSLSVQLDMAALPSQPATAWFDGISLGIDASDVIFANGFD